MSSVDRVVETVSVYAIVGRVLDEIRKMNDEAAKDLPDWWVAKNGPHAPMEQLKEGMISVYTEWYALQFEWKTLQAILYSKKASTDSVETALILLAAAAAKMALDLRARVARQGDSSLDPEESLALQD